MSAKQNKSIQKYNGVWTPCGFRKIINGLILEIAHNKHKRCLAMASRCKAGMYLSYECNSKREWWNKWHERWLKLSDYYEED